MTTEHVTRRLRRLPLGDAEHTEHLVAVIELLHRDPYAEEQAPEQAAHRLDSILGLLRIGLTCQGEDPWLVAPHQYGQDEPVHVRMGQQALEAAHVRVLVAVVLDRAAT